MNATKSLTTDCTDATDNEEFDFSSIRGIRAIRGQSSSPFFFNSSRPSDFGFRISDFRRRGFTLIEIITVLTIIIIVLAIAVPVWNALLGGTNLAGAQNEISAFLANARADATYNHQTIGVFFYTDPKTLQIAMAEVQVQTLWWTASPPGPSAKTFSPLFTPTVPGGANNGLVNAIELVNNPDPNSPGNFVFYRDVALLPKGVGVALNNNSYTYNDYIEWNNNTANPPNPPWGANSPPMDRYLNVGCIMFNPDGTLASIPFGVPYYEWLTSTQTAASENLLCAKIQMTSTPYPYDLGGIAAPNPPGTPQVLPLMSSVGLVIYDHDAYLNQHCGPMTVNSGGTTTTIGNGKPFADPDLEISLNGAFPPAPPSTNAPQCQDKFIQEQWIDQNGTALLVSPVNGSLIKAK